MVWAAAVAASGSVGPELKLLEASERLLANEGDSIRQNAGAALYSSILNRKWDIDQLLVRDALSDTETNKLLEQYKRAFDSTRRPKR